MWSLLLSLALAAQDPAAGALADGVKLYYDGGSGAAAGVFEALFLERPFDDDVAWWVARTRLDRGQAAEALTAVAGRQGRKLPLWRFQVLQATAHLVLDQDLEALALLEQAWPQVRGTADRAAVAAAFGLLLAELGRDATAAQVLAQAGPEPLLVLDPALSGALAEARVFTVRGAVAGQLDVTRRDGTWRVALATGLARRGPDEDPAGPAVWRRSESPRGRPDACGAAGAGHVWTSPREALFSGLPGVYRAQGGEVGSVALTPPGAVDLSPACVGDQVWFVRRLGDHAGVMRTVSNRLDEVPIEVGAVATVDARAGSRGRTELVLGLVVDGAPGVWWLPEGTDAPVPLLEHDDPLLAPRWVD